MLFDTSFSFLQKAMDILNTRHKIISSNIANLNTPGYVAKDIPFIQTLKRFLDRDTPIPEEEIAKEVQTIYSPKYDPYTGGIYSNSVNLDLEMAKLGKTTILFNASTTILAKKFLLLRYAIEEVR